MGFFDDGILAILFIPFNLTICENGESMQIGQKVKVLKLFYTQKRDRYPWMPDLAGKIGEIAKIIEQTPVAHEPLEEPIYMVRFEAPLKVGVVPKGQSSFGYVPHEWVEVETWAFLAHEIRPLPLDGQRQ